ncbi:MAG: hypothetical protein J7L15_07355 [Clostridiales bacterium]|nr:hypothetical protein [Clostridiales bacterium]
MKRRKFEFIFNKEFDGWICDIIGKGLPDSGIPVAYQENGGLYFGESRMRMTGREKKKLKEIIRRKRRDIRKEFEDWVKFNL